MGPIPDIGPTHETSDRQRRDAGVEGGKFAVANAFVEQRGKLLVKLPPISGNSLKVLWQKVFLFAREDGNVLLALQSCDDKSLGDHAQPIANGMAVRMVFDGIDGVKRSLDAARANFRQEIAL